MIDFEVIHRACPVADYLNNIRVSSVKLNVGFPFFLIQSRCLYSSQE